VRRELDPSSLVVRSFVP